MKENELTETYEHPVPESIRDMLASKRPIYELSINGENCKIFLNGETEGFPPKTRIVNWAAAIVDYFQAESYLSARKALNSIKSPTNKLPDGNVGTE